MASRSEISRFVGAMQRVYAFPTETSADNWTPPTAPAGHRGRYLWTDAFGVLNFLTLHRATSQPIYLANAKSLVSTVHSVLGRTRDLSSYLPGASPSNPLGGGLRIGKEDAAGSDGDGQYHHYLTLWMFALNRLAITSGEKEYNHQAISLARAIHPHFVYNRGSPRPRMYWKMSMDLKQPLVKSEGNLDPVDGLVVFRLLQNTDGVDSTVLSEEISDYQRIVDTKWKKYTSSDPLDLGMTLWTAHWFRDSGGWAQGLVDRAERDTQELWESAYLRQKSSRRLAFRDFGMALGIKCALSHDSEWIERADGLVKSWEDAGLVPETKETHSAGMNAEEDLVPIGLVMYAAALMPGVFKMGNAG
ncbi:hypothetical protein CC78DRAFT_573648 [Lojkania enalia]|uniref:Uncharacterized protein n=1 Tax=Lojkania enalia TaxID=147567 RepID=A0A9P4NBV0_9PLEO|nr:hypothetical protein CC78DRAFT_573648 [Didymosphaeria enalia]